MRKFKVTIKADGKVLESSVMGEVRGETNVKEIFQKREAMIEFIHLLVDDIDKEKLHKFWGLEVSIRVINTRDKMRSFVAVGEIVELRNYTFILKPSQFCYATLDARHSYETYSDLIHDNRIVEVESEDEDECNCPICRR